MLPDTGFLVWHIHLSIPSNKTHICTVYVNKSLRRYYKGHIQKSIETEEEGIKSH